MDVCKKCNGKHDLKKACTPKKSQKLEKEIGAMEADSRSSAPKPPLAAGVNNGGLGASIAAGLSGGIRKSEKVKKADDPRLKVKGYSGNQDIRTNLQQKGVVTVPKGVGSLPDGVDKKKVNAQALKESKAMKAPNLPKSEHMMEKNELVAGMSFNDLKKSEELEKANQSHATRKENDKYGLSPSQRRVKRANKDPEVRSAASKYSHDLDRSRQKGVNISYGSNPLSGDSPRSNPTKYDNDPEASKISLGNAKAKHEGTLRDLKAMKAPNLPKSERMMEKSELEVGMSFADLKKREIEMMDLEDRVGSLASHLKDVLKKIK